MNSNASKTFGFCSPPDNVSNGTPEGHLDPTEANLTLARSAIAQIHTDLVMYHRLVVADLPRLRKVNECLLMGDSPAIRQLVLQ